MSKKPIRLTDAEMLQMENEYRAKVLNHEPLTRDETIFLFNRIAIEEERVREARRVARALLPDTEAFSPRQADPFVKDFPWLKEEH